MRNMHNYKKKADFSSIPPLSGKSLFISPHFDDVCFSAGGLLSKKIKDVTILTVFSYSQFEVGNGLKKSLITASQLLNSNCIRNSIARIVTENRISEDREFCKNINASQAILPFRDFSLRKNDLHIHPKIDSSSTPANGIEAQEIYNDTLIELGKFISKSYDHIFCPLGIGNHIDHLLVEKAFVKILKESPELAERGIFYEDMPYASHYDLDLINSLVKQRIETSNPIAIDVSFEMQSKKQLMELYKSQVTNKQTKEILLYSNRLFTTENACKTELGYCERFWCYQ